VRLIAACNSGDTAGGKDSVVGYSSFALYERSDAQSGAALIRSRGPPSRKAARQARRAVRRALARASRRDLRHLLKDGELRGCIGSLEATRPLARTWPKTRSPRRFATRASRSSAPRSGSSARSRSPAFRAQADSVYR
jgi:hypothetical protein